MKTGKYPLATVIGYGPDHKTATKLVASVFIRPGQQDPVALEKWIVQGGDIRQDPSIMTAVGDFIKRHNAAETITYDRVFGCPHEEGIDYPEGQVCPRCPFWANVDRHTLEPKSLDAPLTPEQIIAGLSCQRDTQPLLSFAAAELHRDLMIEPFIQAVERGLADPKNAKPGEALLFSYALAFLVKWREPRALPLVVRWLSLPGEGAFDIGGDTVTEWGSRLLASVCSGDLEPIKRLILNREANESCRGQAIEALAILVAWNERTQGEVSDYFGWLAREGLEREPNHVWGCLACASLDIEAIAAFDDLRRAGQAGLIDESFVGLEELDEAEAELRGLQLERFRRSQSRFEDIVKETSWWCEYHKDIGDVQEEDLPDFDLGLDEDIEPMENLEAAQPYIAPPKVGRNEPCPCGSGKKYKKCCGR
jgi:hypothetical protein